MDYPLLHCKKCITKLSIFNKQVKDEKDEKDVLIGKENNRYLYFAPVGNQFNFGKLAGGKTPRVIIMGITTSPSARDNFIKDLGDLQMKGYNSSKAFRISCINNIFNSKNELIQKVLTKILNMSGITKMIGCTGDIDINRNFFINNEGNDYKIVIENIYFTQMIMCASCLGKNGSKAPKSISKLGSLHKKCIQSQFDFINSFSEKVDLLITFGNINRKIIEKFDERKIIENKCTYHVNIPHPVTKGWNEIDRFNLNRELYIKKIDRIINESDSIKNKAGYKTSLINCYDKFVKIKEIVNLLSNKCKTERNF